MIPIYSTTVLYDYYVSSQKPIKVYNLLLITMNEHKQVLFAWPDFINLN